MIKAENIKVYNIARAVYSARNAMNSWDKSDSDLEKDVLGEKDLELMRKLVKAGPEHRKCLRQMFVVMDITAPLYFWRQADTYKVGTVSNSCSTMHTIHKKPFTMDDFSTDGMTECGKVYLEKIIDWSEDNRQIYNDTGYKPEWRDMICLLPSCYNQKRTVSMNYEVALNIIRQRSGHKLTEWNEFVKVLKGLPYMEELLK